MSGKKKCACQMFVKFVSVWWLVVCLDDGLANAQQELRTRQVNVVPSSLLDALVVTDGLYFG